MKEPIIILKSNMNIFILKKTNILMKLKKLEIAQRNNMPNKDLMVGSLEYLIGITIFLFK